MVLGLEICGQTIDVFDATSVSRDAISPVVVGQDILILEDQALIALDMEGLLLDLGARECWLVSNVVDALKLLETTKLSLAMVDFNLGHETAEVVADRLTELAVPFVFVTGYGERMPVPDRFAAVPIVSKPVVTETLLAKIALARLGVGAEAATRNAVRDTPVG